MYRLISRAGTWQKCHLEKVPFYCQLGLSYSHPMRWKLSSALLYGFLYNCEHGKPHEAINQGRDEGPTELLL